MKIDLSRFQAAFFEESAEHLTTMEEGLLQLERRPDDLDLINRIFRAAHSIKGNSGMFKLTAITEFTHLLENLLDQLRTGKRDLTKPVIDLLLESTDGLKHLIEAAKTGEAHDQNRIAALQQRLTGGTGCHEVAQAVAVHIDQTPLRRVTIEWTPGPTLFQRGLDPVQIVKELEQLGRVQTILRGLQGLPSLVDLDPERCYLAWTFILYTAASDQAIADVFEFVREDSQMTIETDPSGPCPSVSSGSLGVSLPDSKDCPARPSLATGDASSATAGGATGTVPKKSDAASIRVDTEKIDKLINLVGELVITQSMLSQLGSHFESHELPVLQERLAQLERNTREIQERVMSIRMLPVAMVFNKFPRVVRDLAAKSGKDIRLVLTGEETELDKTVIESIGDPLTHLIRNAADHALEPPDERIALGKPAQGTVRLSAYQEGGNIYISVQDDGRGLNREKIMAKARASDMVGPDEQLSDDQVWLLIFRAGFSTAEQVTEVSGRGVGMDVVRRNIEALGGTIAIKTAAGQGTTFLLKLPLTLAIVEGMAVRVGSETYLVPLLSIIESLQPPAGAVKTIVGKGQVINVRGLYIPIVRLYEAFHLEADHTDPMDAILIIVETESERVALMVDELLGQQQVVIKNLEQNFHKVDGLAGATILGDGTVGFIIDVRGMLALSRGVPVAA
ncbi:MAG: two-component system, chemotaxis family, sensor kinase CheA [Nitrospira sp.]|jgi:two-component system chemotaxis sensor kinase CheA|nr:two-component system, chemotaxis family, sensor kinase CheA [Nitrospira sp.]